MLQPIVMQPSLASTQPMFNTYAFGGKVRDSRGEDRLECRRGAPASRSSSWIAEKNVGFSIAINSKDSEIPLGLMYQLLDHYSRRASDRRASDRRS